MGSGHGCSFSGYACFFGVDDGPAAGCDKKEGAGVEITTRTQKSRILAELVELTGWHRDYARAALRDALTLKVIVPCSGRPATYGDDLLPALIRCWAVLRAPAGKLLAPMLPVLVPLLRRDGEVDLTDQQAEPAGGTRSQRGTLPLRMRQHSANGHVIAEVLRDHPEVDWVRYPGLDTDAAHDVASKYMPNGFGGMISFRMTKGKPAMATFCESLELAGVAVSLGDLHTLAYPMPKRDFMVRLSVGCEDPDDLIADVTQALDKVAAL